MQSTVPISTLHLFPVIDRLLIDLLVNLTPDQWLMPTPSKAWNVKAVASHLLDGTMRSVSYSRDGYLPPEQPATPEYQDVVHFLNKINHRGVEAIQMWSPSLITELLSIVNPIYVAHLHTLDAFAPAVFPVAWAGQAVSTNWFHIAREYTEKWHHQQQIRTAIDDEITLFEAKLFIPYLDTSLHALLHQLKNTNANEGDYIQLNIIGITTLQRYINLKHGIWTFAPSPSSSLICLITVSNEILWRIFSKEIALKEVFDEIKVQGDQRIVHTLFQAVAVMA